MSFRIILALDVKKAALASCLIRNTSPPKSFQCNPLKRPLSSISALCLDQDVFGQSDAHQPSTKGSPKDGR